MPVFITSSDTVPSPITLTDNWYFFFSKFAVICWFELIVTVKGLSVDSDPVHPINTYSESGVAVIVTVDPESKEPPVVSTDPPSEAETSILKITVGASVCSSNASFWHVIRTRNEKTYINDFFRVLTLWC